MRVRVTVSLVVAALFAPANVSMAGHECRGNVPGGTRCAESDVSIRYREEKERFAGRVTSHMRWCEKNRKVVLKKVRKGDDRRLAATQTNDEGRWRIDDVGVRGRVFAVARRKERTYGIDSRDICYRAKSKTIHVRG
jgi:hypothetical protein